jgi:hypothetical protein
VGGGAGRKQQSDFDFFFGLIVVTEDEWTFMTDD